MAALAEATLELQTIHNLIPGLTAQVDASMDPASVPPQEPQTASSGRPAEKAAREAEEQESKGGNPKGKGHSANSSGKWESWTNKRGWNQNQGDQNQIQELKQQVELLSTLVLRHESQIMINRQTRRTCFSCARTFPTALRSRPTRWPRYGKIPKPALQTS